MLLRQVGQYALERIFLLIVNYPPYIPPLARGEYKGGEAKASQAPVASGPRMSEKTYCPTCLREIIWDRGSDFVGKERYASTSCMDMTLETPASSMVMPYI
jgi:hypothetical protein